MIQILRTTRAAAVLITLLLAIAGAALTTPSASASTVSRVEVAEHRQIVVVDTGSSSGVDRAVAEPGHPVPTRFINIKVLTKSQATAIAIALKTGDVVTISGLIPEPYSSASVTTGAMFAPKFEACGTDGLPDGCQFGFETSFGSMGFEVRSIGAL